MNDLTNHGVPRAFQLLWRRRPRVAAASWCKRRYGREREWRSRVGLTECGSSTSVDNYRPGGKKTKAKSDWTAQSGCHGGCTILELLLSIISCPPTARSRARLLQTSD